MHPDRTEIYFRLQIYLVVCMIVTSATWDEIIGSSVTASLLSTISIYPSIVVLHQMDLLSNNI